MRLTSSRTHAAQDGSTGYRDSGVGLCSFDARLTGTHTDWLRAMRGSSERQMTRVPSIVSERFPNLSMAKAF